MRPITELLGKEVLCLDGAMGTMIQARGITFESAPEHLNITHPQVIKEIHRAYAKAGAQIVETNSFGGNRLKLGLYGLGDQVHRLNYEAARLARDAVGNEAWVAGSMGPTGKLLEPVGDLKFDETVEIFREQAEALKAGGADLLMVETMSDTREARAAVMAGRSTGLPVFVLVTFQEDLRTLLGVTPEAAAVTLEALDVVAIGANCSLGPEGMVEVAKRMAGVASKPLVFMPNAGLPELVNGETVFPASPEELATCARDLVEIGAAVVGGCCGSTPDHVRLIVEEVRGKRVNSREESPPFQVSGQSAVVKVGRRFYPVMIGERINPTGKEEFKRELREGKTTWARREAQAQAEAGAAIIDVNVGAPGVDEVSLLPLMVTAVQSRVGLPVMIDSSNPDAMEAALKVVEGKPILNSVSAEETSMERVLSMAKRYGAAVLVLPLDKKGIPGNPEGRLSLAEKVVSKATAMGIPRENIIVDGLVMAVSADPQGAFITLNTVRLVRERLGLPTVLGVSNVSFGLPNRPVVNASFLSMALWAGLDAAIVNPLDQEIRNTFAAAALLTGRDHKAQHYLATVKEKTGEETHKAREEKPLSPEDRLALAVIEGDEKGALFLTQELLSRGDDPLAIGNSVLIPAIEEVGRLFESGEYFLPQVMASANAMKQAFGEIKAAMKGKEGPKKATVVMATVEGDIHDIGKNIVCMLLENHGYRVVDLGKNVPAAEILEAAKREKADVVGLSALMTTTMTEMQNVIELLRSNGVSTLSIVGGAVVTPEYAEEIGADGYAKNGVEAVKVVERLLQKKRSP